MLVCVSVKPKVPLKLVVNVNTCSDPVGSVSFSIMINESSSLLNVHVMFSPACSEIALGSLV